MLRFTTSNTIDEQFAAAAAQAIDQCLAESALTIDHVDAIVAAPARPRYRADLTARLGVPEEQIIVAEDESVHTASVAAASDRAASRIRPGGRVLLVTAGAGITAGAALYRLPH